jgi:hypothetical protein
MGGKQLDLSDYELTTFTKQAKREKLFAEDGGGGGVGWCPGRR